MRRALVLSSESARHPFRQSLPPVAFHLGDQDVAAPYRPAPRSSAFANRDDVLFFAASFVGCFVLIYGLIA